MKLTSTFILVALALISLPLSGAFAGENALSGEVMVGGVSKNDDGNEAKANEYVDDDLGLLGGVRINYDSPAYFLRFNAGQTFNEAQQHTVELDGGVWGKFKYQLYYDYLPHNITFDAKSYLSHAGDASLPLKGDPNDPSTWTKFDYETERERVGGSISADLFKPFFLTISAQSEQKEGKKPTSYGDLSGSGVVIELPEPVDYQTDTFRVEGGYNQKPYFASVSYEYSRFANANEALDFYDVSLDGMNSVALPPDNDYYKLGFKGAILLPYNSKLSVNAGSAHAESEDDGNNLLVLDSFDGEVDTTNTDIVLTSSPDSDVDLKVFYSYYDRDNGSDGDEDHLDYTKNKYGGHLGLRLPAHLRMTLGYEYNQTDYQDRYDAEEREDNICSAGLAWSGLDYATFKIDYEFRDRDSDRDNTDAQAEWDTLWRFDVAPSERDTFKASVELFPADDLSVTLGYKYVNTDYEDNSLAYATEGLGLRNQESDTFFVDASYAYKNLKLYGYFDYEWLQNDQYGYSSAAATNWKLTQEEENYDYGVGADLVVIQKVLTVKAQYDYVRSDGSTDFSYLDTATPSGADMDDWGDYRKEAVSIRAVYDITPAFALTAGYLYERLNMDDDQLDGYEYRPAADAYLTGAYDDPSYTANVLFMSGSYKF